MKQIQRLMTPGPAPVPPEVLEILALPMEHHRTPGFVAIFKEIKTLLRELFQTSNEACVLTSTGSGAMEAAVVNFFSPGEEVLVIVSGKFGERWAEMCENFGLHTYRMNLEWGNSAEPKEIAAFLKSHPGVRGVFSQVCETSTGALHPVQAMAAEIAKTSAIFLVDAITALGAMPLPMDSWGLDVVVGGSQKALMLPTGLSFIAWSKKAEAFLAQAKMPRYYFDLRREAKSNKNAETHFSSAVTHLRALHWVLKNNFSGSTSTRVHDDVSKLQRATLAGAKALGLKLFPQNPSPSLSVIVLPEGVDGAMLRDRLESVHGITLMGGQDQLKGRVLRMGHMGYILPEDVIATFRALATELKPDSTDKVLRAIEGEFKK